MDSDLVLVRTNSGEAAVQQPTSLVQRNLRMALMLVDGVRSAGEIVGHFSDGSIGKSALADLRRAGMIRLATDTNTNAAERAGAVAACADPIRYESVSLPPQVTEQHPGVAEAVIEVITLDDHIEAVPSHNPAVGEKSQKRSWTSQHPQESTTIKVVSREGDMDEAARSDRPGRRAQPSGSRARRGTFLSVLALISAIVLLIAGIAHSYPYERHLPSLERQLSQAVDQPVRIGAISFTWTPLPSITLEHVVIGADDRLTVAIMRVVPDPRAMFGGDVVLYSMRLENLSLTGEALSAVSGWLSRAAEKRHLVVRHLDFIDGALVLKDTTMTGFRGEWDMTDGGRPQSLHFERAEGTISGDLIPRNGAYQLTLRGNNWKPDFLAPMVVDHFDAEGVIDSRSMQLSKVYARIADGSIFGDASVTWDGDSRYSAQLGMRSVDIARLIAQTKSDLSMKGTVSGSLKLGPAPLGDARERVLAEGNVSLHRGVLDRFDFVEAVRAAKRHEVRGGATRFEEGTARVRIDSQNVRVSRLRMQSGLMSADGEIAIGSDQTISGGVNVELHTSSGKVRAPVSISGLLGDPVLTAERSHRGAQSETGL